ncbi:MAG: sigma-54 dependent transcriptional regulator [Thermodesulfobacteriota bacterium]
MSKILLIDDDKNILTTLEIYIQELGVQTMSASTGVQGVSIFHRERPEIVFLDLKLPDQDGLKVLEEILAAGPTTYVVIITAYATIDTAVAAIKKGAYDYLPKPFTPAQIKHVLDKIIKVRALEREVESLKGIVREGDFITRNAKMRDVLRLARQLAEASAGILISGESGTGKGILARLVHDWSPRWRGPFIIVDCAGLQENLLESDLFGHVRGAFTGALKDKVGKLELADNGTVFLDEVSELSPAVQAKLLHFLQHHEFERLGDPRPIKVDVRVIAATNKDLEDLVREKLFRSDLYFRLNIVEIFLPPLRERPEDIQIIAEHYLARFARVNRKNLTQISDQVMRRLEAYPWPGNVRELVNVMERGAILARGDRLESEDLPPHIAGYSRPDSEAESLKPISEVEREHIQRVLLRSSSLEEAARVLGIDPATLWRKRKKYNLD